MSWGGNAIDQTPTWEDGEVVGILETVEDGQYGPVLHIKTDTGGERKVYVGQKYIGPKAEVGTYAKWFFVEKKQPGKKYGSKYLQHFEATNGHSPASVPSGGTTGASNAPLGELVPALWALAAATGAGGWKTPEELYLRALEIRALFCETDPKPSANGSAPQTAAPSVPF